MAGDVSHARFTAASEEAKMSLPEKYDVVEYFAGKARIAKAARKAGLEIQQEARNDGRDPAPEAPW